jgi:hypothetical protein
MEVRQRELGGTYVYFGAQHTTEMSKVPNMYLTRQMSPSCASRILLRCRTQSPFQPKAYLKMTILSTLLNTAGLVLLAHAYDSNTNPQNADN